MRVLANIIWLVLFFGWVNSVLSFLLGIILSATGLCIPIGLGLIQYAKFLLLPFTHEMMNRNDVKVDDRSTIMKLLSFVVFILYIPFGIILSLLSIFQCVGLFISIIGIPAGIVLAKSLSTILNPINKICVEIEVAKIARDKKAHAKFEKINS